MNHLKIDNHLLPVHREYLMKALLRDQVDMIRADYECLERVVLGGLKGLSSFTDFELVAAAAKAGLLITLADIGIEDPALWLRAGTSIHPVCEYRGVFLCITGHTWRIKRSPGAVIPFEEGEFESNEQAFHHIDHLLQSDQMKHAYATR
jgi:hypothetical protein